MDISYWCWIITQSMNLSLTLCAVFGGAIGAILGTMFENFSWAKTLICIVLGATIGAAFGVAIIVLLDTTLCTFN